MNTRIIPLGRQILASSVSISRLFFQRKGFAYKSNLSLDKLYPNSSLKITTPEFVPLEPNAKFSGYIPIDKLDITYSCSSAPGGQNVNKVHTKVDLRFKIDEANWLDQSIREKLAEQHKNKISKEGYFIIKSEVTRSQQLNLADCMKKLREMIRKAAEPEPQASPESLERARKRKEKAARERLIMKRAESNKKAESRPPTIHEL